MLKLLFSAFSCLPDRGSEPGVGWNWAVQAAKNQDLDVTVLTRSKCRRKIEPVFRGLGMNNLHFIYVPSSERLRRISIYLEYVAWQYSAYNYIRMNYDKDDFDCLWHITFGNVFLPIWAHRLPYRFIWGPMGGGEHIPPAFYRSFPVRASVPHRVKLFLIKTARFNPFVQGPAKKASLILARTEETRSLFRKEYLHKTRITLETRMDERSIPQECFTVTPYDDGRLHVCYTGRLIPLKNVDKLLAAVASLIDGGLPIALHLIGGGRLQRDMEFRYKRYVSSGDIMFHGQLPREEALRIVAACQVFAFPSLREGGSWSLMEAMVLGRTIICFDASGMHEMLDRDSALLIPMIEPSEVEMQLRDAIRILAENPGLMSSLGKAARERARSEFCWDEVRARVALTTRAVCGG